MDTIHATKEVYVSTAGEIKQVKEINEGELSNKLTVLECETAQKTGESKRRKLQWGIYFDTYCLEQ